jgi:hypothetical protein
MQRSEPFSEVYRGPRHVAETTQPAADEQPLSELSPQKLSARLLAPVSDHLEQGWVAHHNLNTVRTAMSLSEFTASFCPRSEAEPG